ncbi:hypothetical protein BFW01_g2325 [Lasiodiplodia theobromae]|uniref:CFEM domain-containing protein n=1 Tax=Lasiodiplodia theobromae TaxID=45133 RepID=A0A5N5DH84_9PEZI|nr:Cfem domain-containing protein [Lasiodiplodia theobromae]KAB2577175.1 hypothetical protein DBV05_g4270 [Lasiodiplodia theobromae]KAF4543723.1 Cfem domain-containing protein [Lasiodiplodia theobromae]KAF9631463.1 hypothetical protein BFW01_g2325 [Lasiodiplodia theobromae]
MLSFLLRVALVTSFLSGAFAQTFDFSSLPECAQKPILNTIGKSKCDPSRLQCLCNDDAIISNLAPLIAQACSGDDMMRAVASAHALCPNLSTQSVITVTDAKTTMTINVGQMSVTPTAPVTTASASGAEASGSASESGSAEPTASGTGANTTSDGNSTSPEQFHGDAPEFGPMRLWSMIIGILIMAMIFAEL